MPSASRRPGSYDQLRRAAFPSDLGLSFAEAAAAKGYLKPERLHELRAHHERLRRRGFPISMGALLLKRGELTVEQYLEILGTREVQAPPPVPRSREESPRFVLGRYRIVREIGRGGMGIVYEARDSVLGRRVALKVLQPQEPPSSTAIDRFRREAAIGAKLQHPNIVGVHEFGAAQDSLGRRLHFIAMDYLEGRTLSRVREEGTSTLEELLRILEDVGRAVAYAHRKGVIHRDLKPSNVIVDPSGRAMLADFGLATSEDHKTRLTASGVLVGTPAYMAPEQVRGETGRVDARTDVYALGAMMYEVLTGKPPFPDEPSPLLLQNILTADPVPPRSRVATIDPRLERIVLKSMEKDPARRYPSAREWVEDVARCRQGEPTAARPTGRALRGARRLAVAGAFLAMAAVAGFLVQRTRDPRRESRRVDEMPRVAAEVDRPRRALLSDDAARVERNPPLAGEPGYAPALYERAVLTARLRGRRMDEIAEEYWRDEVDVQVAPVLSRQALARTDARAEELRTRLKADLEAILARDPAALEPAELCCARGLQAWAAGDLSLAQRLLTEALEQTPALKEAREALAILEMERRRYEESIRWFTRGLERDRGRLPCVEGRAFAHFLRALELSGRGAPAEEEFAAAAADFDAALKTDRRSIVRSGLGRLAWAYHRARSGRDPGDLFGESIRAFDEAVATDRDPVKARLWRGLARTLWGLSTLTVPALGGPEGRDPRALLDAAIADFDVLIEGPSAPDAAWMWRGAAYVVQGIVLASRFADATPSYDRALGDLSEAIRRDPARDEAWMWRGIARKWWAIREYLTVRDSRPAYQAAVEDFDEALRRNPGRADSWTHRGEARLLWATFAMPIRGENPLPVLSQAIADLDESILRNPSQGVVWSYRGNAKESTGRLRGARQESDAKEWYRAALKDYEEAARLDPDRAFLLAKNIEGCLARLKQD